MLYRVIGLESVIEEWRSASF